MAARHPETTLSRCGSFLSTTILACFSSFFLFYETAASQTHVSPRPTHLHPVEPDADGTLDVRFARHSRPQSDWRGRYSATKKIQTLSTFYCSRLKLNSIPAITLPHAVLREKVSTIPICSICLKNRAAVPPAGRTCLTRV